MKKIIGVYFIKNNVTGKFYVGHSINILTRFVRHKRDLNGNIHHCIHLQRAWNKYGGDNFEFSIYQICENEEESIKLEQECINKFNNLLYNTSDCADFGGDTIRNHPNRELIIAKRSNSLKATISKMSKEERTLKYAKNGEQNGMYGKEVPVHIREYLSELYIGKESRYKGMSYEERYGKEKSEKIKKQISKRAKERVNGKNNPFFGRKHSDKAKKIMSEKKKGNTPANRRKVIVDGIPYNSLMECSKVFGITPATLINRIRSKNYPNFKYAD